ncbi:tail protein [Alsobacter metallidurans]|uniref:Tail protein n=1 Tax=Alsobacter metallidurans TaxID=340221 RepID=A0A917I4I6_9HYPH|nr:phage tail tape measure protein [Alsobacter metallidurans]GGH13924.1 tail protein [Alsobacter metallidurans]
MTMQDFATQEAQLTRLDGLAQAFGKSITSAFAKGATDGKRFEDVLRGLGLKLQDIALKAAMKPLEGLLTTGLSNILGNSGGLFGGGSAPVQAFADGGVVRAPTYFPLGQGLGLAGEAGPEAILPLARGPDGALGVRAGAGGGRSVTVNITTPDAESFRRSEATVSAAIARAVARGQRGL